MNSCVLTTLIDSPDIEIARVYPFGAILPRRDSSDKRLSRFMTKLLSICNNALGLTQPLTIQTFVLMLVLEVRRAPFV
jgi:hypothetical protein